ncbi:MATE family efflux transporter [Paracoccus sp. p4-l81]|uniref:MATE family efflux transporter n=1 Tax=unclassified Paracoccus (in: a-proteobacteria) TaxID=2688777 RepID=UPI0035B9E072
MMRASPHPLPKPFLAELRTTVQLGLPLILSLIASMLLGVTDTVMMGWYGVPELAAVTLGSSTFFTIFILGGGFGTAVMGVVAAARARGDDDQLRRATRMAIWLSVIFAALALPVFWASAPILRALGQSPQVAGLAQDYLRIMAIGMFAAQVSMVLRSYLAAIERTAILLVVTLIGLVVNAALNWLLIFGHGGFPELGVQGAAIASVTTQFVMLALQVVYAARRAESRRVRLFHRLWKPDRAALAEVFRLGWPIGLTGLSESGLFQASALMMGWIGTVELAAHGIALQITSLTFMVHVGLSNAATVRVGRAFGAGDIDRMDRAAWAAIALSLAMVVATAAVFLTVPGQIVGLFLDRADPAAARIIAIGSLLLFMSALFQLFDAMQCQALGLLRGVQDTRVPMWLAGISYWLIGIPAGYLLAFTLNMGPEGLWLGLVIGLAAASVLLMARFWRGQARRRAG